MNEEVDSVKDLKDSLTGVIKNTQDVLAKLEKLIENSIIDEEIRNSSKEILFSIIDEFKKLNFLQDKVDNFKNINIDKKEEE